MTLGYSQKFASLWTAPDKADPPFALAQGKLFADDSKKSRSKSEQRIPGRDDNKKSKAKANSGSPIRFRSGQAVRDDNKKSRSKSEQRIPVRDDNKKSRSKSEQQIPFGDDNKKGKDKSNCRYPSRMTTREEQLLLLLAEVDGLDAEEFGGLAQFLFDAEELVVLGDAVGAAG